MSSTKGVNVPVLVVHGVSRLKYEGPKDLKHFLDVELPEAVASIEEMKVEPGNVTVFAPEGQTNNARAVVILVEGLYQRTERTPEVLQRLAEKIKNTAVSFVESCLPDCTEIEVILRSQRLTDAYVVWEAD